jgi:hypothetical protein
MLTAKAALPWVRASEDPTRPTIAPRMINGSAAEATASGRGVSCESCERPAGEEAQEWSALMLNWAPVVLRGHDAEQITSKSQWSDLVEGAHRGSAR